MSETFKSINTNQALSLWMIYSIMCLSCFLYPIIVYGVGEVGRGPLQLNPIIPLTHELNPLRYQIILWSYASVTFFCVSFLSRTMSLDPPTENQPLFTQVLRRMLLLLAMADSICIAGMAYALITGDLKNLIYVCLLALILKSMQHPLKR